MSTYLHTVVVFIALCLFAFEIYAVPKTGLGSPAVVWEHLMAIAQRGGAHKGVSWGWWGGGGGGGGGAQIDGCVLPSWPGPLAAAAAVATLPALPCLPPPR